MNTSTGRSIAPLKVTGCLSSSVPFTCWGSESPQHGADTPIFHESKAQISLHMIRFFSTTCLVFHRGFCQTTTGTFHGFLSTIDFVLHCFTKNRFVDYMFREQILLLGFLCAYINYLYTCTARQSRWTAMSSEVHNYALITDPFFKRLSNFLPEVFSWLFSVEIKSLNPIKLNSE